MSTRQMEELRSRREQLIVEGNVLLEDADADEEDIERCNKELEQVGRRIEKLEELYRHAQDPRRVASGSTETDPQRDREARDAFGEAYAARRDWVLRAAERARLTDAAMQTVEELIGQDRQGVHGFAEHLVAIATAEYRRAFEKWICDPERGREDWEPEEAAAVRRVRLVRTTMAEGADPTGGYAVPLGLDPSFGSMITGAGSTNPVENVCRTVQTLSKQWTPVTAGQISASVDGENVEVSDDAPTLTGTAITVYKSAVFVPVSLEAAADIPNFAQEVTMVMADAAANLRAQMLVTGTGTSQPWGCSSQISGITASRVARSTASSFAPVDVYSTLNAMPYRHVDNSQWMASLPIINRIRDFGTPTGSNYTVDLQMGGPQYLVGRPISVLSSMTSSIGTNAGYLLVGDFSRFVVARRAGMVVEYVPHLFGATFRPTGTRGFYAYERYGSAWIDTNAARQLTG